MKTSTVTSTMVKRYSKRPTTAIGRDVYSCHPPKVEPIVRGIIDSFRKGDRDNVAVWLEKQGRPFYVNYMAVRDKIRIPWHIGTRTRYAICKGPFRKI